MARRVLVVIDNTSYLWDTYEALLEFLLKERKAGRRALVTHVDGNFPR